MAVTIPLKGFFSMSITVPSIHESKPVNLGSTLALSPIFISKNFDKISNLSLITNLQLPPKAPQYL